jgi:hypothetical protein
MVRYRCCPRAISIITRILIAFFFFSIDTFIRADPSGRLLISSLPNLLERFGIILTVNDLTSAAQKLQYDRRKTRQSLDRHLCLCTFASHLADVPISARRLIHILIQLGRIVKSAHHQSTAIPASAVATNGHEQKDSLAACSVSSFNCHLFVDSISYFRQQRIHLIIVRIVMIDEQNDRYEHLILKLNLSLSFNFRLCLLLLLLYVVINFDFSPIKQTLFTANINDIKQAFTRCKHVSIDIFLIERKTHDR